jgi:hypothetical protein
MGPENSSTSKPRHGVSSGSDLTTEEAGYAAAERNGSPQAASRAISAIGAEREGLHPSELLLRLMDERFERRLLTHGPVFFPDLVDTTEADEQTAIDAALIRPTRIEYVGTRR